MVVSVAHKEDGVIDGGVAESLDNAFLIEFEAERACIDTDGDWALNESSGECDRIVSLNLLEIAQLDVASLLLLGTLAVFGVVRILVLGLQRNMLGVVVTILDEATAASIISVGDGAVDELLLGQKNLASILDPIGTFN